MSPAADKLGIGFVISPSPLTNPCLTLDGHATNPGGELYPPAPVYLYARKAPQSS